MNLVLDTNVLVSGLLWSGAPAGILDRIDAGTDRLFVSRPLLLELAEVLARPKFARAFQAHRFDPAEALSAIVAASVIVEAKPLPGVVVVADPTDDRVLACAATAGVDVIVSGDAHLSALREFRGIPILSPVDYLKRVGIRPPRGNP